MTIAKQRVAALVLAALVAAVGAFATSALATAHEAHAVGGGYTYCCE